MNGDFASLTEIVNICEKYNAALIVDEAHATGIYGSKGEGIVSSKGLNEKVLARVHTFGKAIGANGATILCSSNLKEFLINYCRPFIFSTALPIHSLAAIKCGYQFLEEAENRKLHLHFLIDEFKKQFNAENCKLFPSSSQIQSIYMRGNAKVKYLAEELQKKGFDVRPILSPTVPIGKERIRICLHSFNSVQEVHTLVRIINSF